MTKSKNNRTKTEKIIFATVLVLFIIYTISMVYPFVWAFLSSMRKKLDFARNNFAWPEQISFNNYLRAFSALNANGHNMFVMLFNSIWYCLGSTLITLFSSVMVAYAVAKYKFVGRDIIYKIAIFIMMVPIIGSLPATYLLYNTLGIYNTPLILISSTCGFGFEFLVLYSYFRNLSWSYAEASFIDGAGHFTVFFKVMVPQAISAIVALALISFIGNWNNYMNPILFLPDFPTLSSGLYTYQIEQKRNMDYPLLFAGVLLSVLPVLILFVVFQNTLMDMSIAGGLKE